MQNELSQRKSASNTQILNEHFFFHCQKQLMTILENTELRVIITNCNFVSENLHLRKTS